MKRPTLATAFALCFALALSPLAASAGNPRADALAREAMTLGRQGDFDAAIAKLQEAAGAAPGDVPIRFQLASMLASQGRFVEAGPIFNELVKLDPTNSAARRGEITALLLEARYVDARTKLEEGLTALPRDGQLAHTLARLCATAPLDKVRDGELAVQLAEKVYEIKKTYATGETLAMAYAESGRFDEALEIQRQLIARAEREGDEKPLETLRERLLVYLRKEPWRAPSPAEIAMATEPPKPGG